MASDHLQRALNACIGVPTEGRLVCHRSHQSRTVLGLPFNPTSPKPCCSAIRALPLTQPNVLL
jgi:hypothetical protein